MKKLIVIVIIGFLGWQGYTKYQGQLLALANSLGTSKASDTTASRRYEMESSASSSFKCDGRTYCSQMTSCEEATFFLKNCPGVKMDGNNDGIPCEKQWCK